MHTMQHLLDLYKRMYAESHEVAVRAIYDLGVIFGMEKAQAEAAGDPPPVPAVPESVSITAGVPTSAPVEPEAAKTTLDEPIPPSDQSPPLFPPDPAEGSPLAPESTT